MGETVVVAGPVGIEAVSLDEALGLGDAPAARVPRKLSAF